MSRTKRTETPRGHWLRHPKTQAERRLASAVEDEPKPRAKRNAANLPTSYDDLPIAAQNEKPKKLT